MPRQRPQIPAKNDALACADSIELLDPSRVGMIACHAVLSALGANETETFGVFILPGKLAHWVAHESSDQHHFFRALACQ